MSNKSDGCIIFAYNTDKIDYFSQAVVAADRVSQHLNLPVTIFTNELRQSKHNVILTEMPPKNFKQKNIWYNRSRTRAFDFTPYSKTLVIDSDYFLNTDTLKYHFNSKKSFLIAQEIYNPINGKKIIHYVGQSRIPLMWATTMIFDCSNEAKQIFEFAKIVEKHYDYYAKLYGFHHSSIRNDYIFSIACHVIGGYGKTSYAFKNYPIVNCNSDIFYEGFKNNKFVYKYMRDKMYCNRLHNIDLHLMNKDQL